MNSKPKEAIDDTSNAEEADFETAVTATGFGKFNLILMLLFIPAGWTSVLQTVSMSYVLPAAQCDLNLSVRDKGMLNAAPYIGMACSGLFWGFIADTVGRKKLLVVGYFLDGTFVLLSGFSQSFTFLVVCKFFGGFIINGPFSAAASYISEFHAAKYRSRIMILRGILVTSANIFLPLLAWVIFPLNINITLFDVFVLHSWNIFLLIVAIPSLISSLNFTFLPESPKFLMSCGENDKALTVFKQVYSMNSGKEADTYPIKRLVDETKHHPALKSTQELEANSIQACRTKKQIFVEKVINMKPILFAPHRLRLLLVCLLQFGLIMGVNTLKLWLPQIFTAISNYQQSHNGSTSNLCEMLTAIEGIITHVNETIVEQPECVVNLTDDFVYINSVIVACTSILGFLVVGLLINTFEKKNLFVCLAFVSGACVSSLYFAQDTPTTVALSSLFVAQSTIAHTVLLAIAVDLFPTNFRTITVALTIVTGRIGAMFGNLIFPILLELGCLPAFLYFGVFTILCGFIAMVLPRTHLKALE